MTRIAVLHLINRFESTAINGIVQHLLQYLVHDEYTLHVGGLAGSGNMQEDFNRLGVHVVDFSDQQNGLRNFTGKIRKYVATHHIRLVHTHTPRTIVVAAMALAGMHNRIHLTTKHGLNAYRDRRWGLTYTVLDRFSLYLPDHLVAVSQKMCHQLLAYPAAKPRDVTVIPNGVDYESYYVPDQRNSCRLEFGLTSESQVIGYTGRIERVKRIDLLLKGFSQALATYPQARLLIVGEGELRSKLNVLAAGLGISHAVIWTGYRRDIPRLLSAMDVYVQPSGNEGLSLGLLEAMAAGKSVIATDVGGTSEVVNEKTGVLIPPRSHSALGTAISDLLDQPEKRLALACTARSQVAQNFGLRQMMEAYRRLYKTLVLQL